MVQDMQVADGDPAVEETAWRQVANYLLSMIPYEESVMSCCGYPAFAEHHRAHRRLVRLLATPRRMDWYRRLIEALLLHCCRDDGILALHLLQLRCGPEEDDSSVPPPAHAAEGFDHPPPVRQDSATQPTVGDGGHLAESG
jgi:hypothetical protein